MSMRRRKHKEDSGFNIWRSYSDMMCGLLLLFVLIMCVTLFQAQKNYNDSLQERDERLAMQEQYTQEILEQQNTLDAQQGQIQTQDEQLSSYRAQLDELAAQLEEQEAQLNEQSAQLEEQSAQLNAQQASLDEKTQQLATQQQQIENIIGVKAEVIEALQQEFTAQNVNVNIDSTTGALMLDANVMFDYNEAVLTEEGEAVLQEVLPIYCQVLMQDEYTDDLAEIIIDGYTDTSGDYAYNLSLSQRRSLAVAQYLLEIQEEFLTEEQTENLKEHLTVNGHSMSNPILDEEGNVDMDASRRVEIKFRLKDEEMIEELNNLMQEQQAETSAETTEQEASETTAESQGTEAES